MAVNKYLSTILLLAGVANAATLRTNDSQQFTSAKAERNYVKNSGAENNDLNVTDASSIHSRSTSSVIEGDASHLIDSSSSGQVVCFPAQDFQTNVTGGSCEASFKYTGDASLYKAYAQLAGVSVTDTTNNQLSTISSGRGVFSANFPCGASTTDDPQVCIESTSASAAAIRVDSVYVGEATGVGSGINTTSPVAYTPTFTGFGTVSGVAMRSWREGSFLRIQGRFTAGTTTATEARMSLGFNGTDSNVTSSSSISTLQLAGYMVTGSVAAASYATLMEASKTYVTFGYQTAAVAALSKANGNQVSGSTQTFSIDATIPIEGWGAETIVRLDAPGVFPNQYTPTLTGSSNGLAFTNQTTTGSYQCSAGVLTVWVRTLFSGAPGTGTGHFVWSLPTGFTIDTARMPTLNAGDVALGAASIRDAGTTFYRGVVRYHSTTGVSVLGNDSGAESSPTTPMTVANTDTFGFEYVVPVTDSSPCSKSPQVLIPGSMYSSSAGVERIERAIVGTTSCTASPCTIAKQSGSWLTSITRNTTGTYTLNIASGTFSDTPSCVATASRFGVADSTFVSGPADSSTPSATAYSFKTIDDTGVLRDSGFHVQCQGPR